MKPMKKVAKGSPYIPFFENANIKLLVILLALAILAVYANAISGTFVWDDQTIVVRNEAIKSFNNIPFIFTHEFGDMVNYKGNIYRPMQELSYMLDYFLWGMDSIFFHLTNIMLQIGCALALFLLVLKVSASKFIAFFTALIFGIHPINTEAVTYISGRSDPLYFLFLLLSFIFYLKFRRSGKVFKKAVYIFSSSLFYALSLLSRETAMVFPFVLAAYEMFGVDDKRERNFYPITPFLGILTAYLLFRSLVVHIGSGQGALPDFGSAIFINSKSIVKYLALLIAPINLHMWNVTDILKETARSQFIFNIIILAALAASVIFASRKNKKMLFWFSWFLIFLAPHLNIVKLNAPFAEHWIFSASAGIYAIIGTLIFNMASNAKMSRMAAYAILFTAFLYFSILTISRNADWKDEPALYNNTLKYARFPKVLSNLGVYYEIKGEYDKSVKAYTEALDLAPNVPLYHNNIAIVYEKMNYMNMAVKHWKKSLEINPGQPKIIELMKDSVSG